MNLTTISSASALSCHYSNSSTSSFVQDAARRSCQTVLTDVLLGLLSAIAPMAPHMAEDAWINLPYQRPFDSVFQAGWAKSDAQWASLPEVSH